MNQHAVSMSQDADGRWIGRFRSERTGELVTIDAKNEMELIVALAEARQCGIWDLVFLADD